ncbi:MAG: sugar kinase [Bacteroidetes bacterium HGW-Bacteroidetes-3]|jgi:glucokinase|nr:MAG: sugar kinase [Bacteroidetes bacterium HGW-Bacteroidetes-3]
MTKPEEINLIGIDLGGTKINAGLIKGNNIIDKRYKLLPQNAENEWVIINLIIDLIKDFLSKNTVSGIGIGVPSILNREKGIIYNVQNIPTWKEIHLADILKKEFGIPVFLDNDANCFALGEYRFGQGKNCKNMVGLTVGTGMGAGIITNGHLISDANGGAGEFGMIQYKDSIFEDYCSGKFFKRQYHLTGEELKILADQGNAKALEAFEEFGKHLGNAIKAIMYAVDPQKIIIGGSVVKSAKYFDKSLKQSIQEIEIEKMLENFKIIYSNTPDIALLGATSLYYDRLAIV